MKKLILLVAIAMFASFASLCLAAPPTAASPAAAKATAPAKSVATVSPVTAKTILNIDRVITQTEQLAFSPGATVAAQNIGTAQPAMIYIEVCELVPLNRRTHFLASNTIPVILRTTPDSPGWIDQDVGRGAKAYPSDRPGWIDQDVGRVGVVARRE